MSLPAGHEPNSMYLEQLVRVVLAHTVVVDDLVNNPRFLGEALRHDLKRWLDRMWYDAFAAGAGWQISQQRAVVQVQMTSDQLAEYQAGGL